MTTPARSAPGRSDDSPDLDTELPTGEVGSEGGSPGDLEIVRRPVGTGSEAGEQWRPADDTNATREIRRDDTGEGRRSP